MGDIVNFKTYSKSFKNKRRLENHAIFEGVHEPNNRPLHVGNGWASSGGHQAQTAQKCRKEDVRGNSILRRLQPQASLQCESFKYITKVFQLLKLSRKLRRL